MIVNLFETFVIINNINLNKIKLKNSKFKKTWLSKTESSYETNYSKKIQDVADEDSLNYILNILVEMLEEKVKYPFKISITHLWQNNYTDNDYQEPHIHSNSDFSFVIYESVDDDGGKTLFFNPNKNLILAYSDITHMFNIHFLPKCKAGQIILFPSFLEHMVLKNSQQKTISGNIKFEKI